MAPHSIMAGAKWAELSNADLGYPKPTREAAVTNTSTTAIEQANELVGTLQDVVAGGTTNPRLVRRGSVS